MTRQLYEILKTKPHNHHYLKRYYKFIISLQNQSVNNIYTERHHICPKSKDLFPEFDNLRLHSWNLIRLTARQHFIAHWMLWKTYGGSQRYAFLAMARGVKNRYQNRTVKINSTTYSKLKTEYIDSTRGKNNYFHQHRFIGEKNPFYGKTHTDEFKIFMSNVHRGKIESDETRKRKSESHVGSLHTQETIQKMKSLRWFYDPLTGKQTKSNVCPDGYVSGRKK